MNSTTNCPNPECFCDGSCYNDQAFEDSWQEYQNLCDELGLEVPDGMYEYAHENHLDKI